MMQPNQPKPPASVVDLAADCVSDVEPCTGCEAIAALTEADLGEDPAVMLTLAELCDCGGCGPCYKAELQEEIDGLQ